MFILFYNQVDHLNGHPVATDHMGPRHRATTAGVAQGRHQQADTIASQLESTQNQKVTAVSGLLLVNNLQMSYVL